MKINNYLLFIIPSLIWGSTWYVIKFQLGVVDPIISISYRFLAAGLLLFIVCLILKLNLKYPIYNHIFMALQGISLFGINYWLVYLAEIHLTSGLIAVVFSLLIFLNIIFNSIILKAPINGKLIIGGLLGITGTFLIFKTEITNLNISDKNFISLVLCFIAVVLASLGNIISAFNQKKKLPVIQTNAYGMTYGALAMILIALFKGTEFKFDSSPSYILSLVYLTIFGSIIAFSTYLKLLGNIGPNKAAYAALLVPVIAMLMSTIFEEFSWDYFAILGIFMLLGGNVLALKAKTRKK